MDQKEVFEKPSFSDKCPNVTGRAKGEDSPKQAGSRWFARPC